MRLLLAGLTLLIAFQLHAFSIAYSLSYLQASPDYVNLSTIDGLRFDLRYATSNNFTGQNLYGEFNQAYLHSVAAEKLRKAVALLHQRRPDLHLLIFDALRPRSVQYILWEYVKGTEQQRYVADPSRGSIHNYGFALDLTLVDDKGHELDMGTAFDDFTPLAQPLQEQAFLQQGRLTQAQLENRLLLRSVMEAAGLIQLPLEWWHFDALPKAEVKQNYPIIE